MRWALAAWIASILDAGGVLAIQISVQAEASARVLGARVGTSTPKEHAATGRERDPGRPGREMLAAVAKGEGKDARTNARDDCNGLARLAVPAVMWCLALPGPILGQFGKRSLQPKSRLLSYCS
jgi:hypothetical protein